MWQLEERYKALFVYRLSIRDLFPMYDIAEIGRAQRSRREQLKTQQIWEWQCLDRNKALKLEPLALNQEVLEKHVVFLH